MAASPRSRAPKDEATSMLLSRRTWLQRTAGGLLAPSLAPSFAESPRKTSPLKITGLKVTPVALPDPPILAASGCHGPYFLRNIVQLQTDAGVIAFADAFVVDAGALAHAAKVNP